MDKPKLLNQVRAKIRLKHYSPKTEEAYINWILKYIYFNNKIHPQELGEREIEKFLTYLAQKRYVAASTQNQALNALLFLYREVLEQPLGESINSVRAKKKKRLPVFLSIAEINRILPQLKGMYRLVVELLYGGGFRLNECLTLRVKEIDFERNRILIVDGKGGKDRITLLPKSIKDKLRIHIQKVEEIHKRDLAIGYGNAFLPDAFHRKNPSAIYEFKWQFIFPARTLFKDEKTGNAGRWHVNPKGVQNAIKTAAKSAGINKRVTSHTFRHSFATHILEAGCDIKRLQMLLGHRNIKTTMIYTHIVDMYSVALDSPLDKAYEQIS